MLIQCPICTTSIEVTNAQIGQKGRCQKCESKFIIPEDPDAEFEILERGEAPEEESPDEESSDEESSDEESSDEVSPDEESRPKVALKLPAKGTPVRAGFRLRPGRSKQSSAGFLVAIIVTGVGLAFGLNAINNHRDKALAAEPAEIPDSPTAGESNTPQPDVLTPRLALEKIAPGPVVAGADHDDVPPETVAATDTDTDDTPPAEEKVNELSEEKKARALSFLKSDQAVRRTAAYNAFRKLGDDWKTAYSGLLEEAREYYLAQLGDKAFDVSIGTNSLTDFEDAYEEWKSAADIALNKVQTNWKAAAPKDYKAKHAEMDRAFDKTANLYRGMLKAAKGAGDRELEMLQSSADILSEIETELDWCAGVGTASKSKMRDLIAEAGGADDFVELLDLLTTARAATDDRAMVATHNGALDWATPTYQSFTTLLNDRRVVLGLRTLRLEEKLSNSCEAHSADMAAKGYFSHTGADGSSFVSRAKRAGFKGGPSGECIFMGSAAAHTAHRAWWYSDGHRLIMYANRPNTLGLGTASKHWTLNTGRFRW